MKASIQYTQAKGESRRDQSGDTGETKRKGVRNRVRRVLWSKEDIGGATYVACTHTSDVGAAQRMAV